MSPLVLKGGKVRKVAGSSPASEGTRLEAQERQRVDPHPALLVRLHIDPDDPRAADDRYQLLRADGSIHREITVETAERADGFLQLRFTGLSWSERYSLLVDEGREGQYHVFMDEPLERLLAPRVEDEPGLAPFPSDTEVEPEELVPPVPGDVAKAPGRASPPAPGIESASDVEKTTIR
jgi:hypothetical protein